MTSGCYLTVKPEESNPFVLIVFTVCRAISRSSSVFTTRILTEAPSVWISEMSPETARFFVSSTVIPIFLSPLRIRSLTGAEFSPMPPVKTRASTPAKGREIGADILLDAIAEHLDSQSGAVAPLSSLVQNLPHVIETANALEAA